jgi:hypothetical protein
LGSRAREFWEVEGHLIDVRLIISFMQYYVIDDDSFLCYAELSINQWVLRGHLCVRRRAPFIGNFGQSRLGSSRLGPLPDWGFDPTYLLGMHEMLAPCKQIGYALY